MERKRRFLDNYFYQKIKNLGFQTSLNEVTKFFNETGWRLYDMETMIKSFQKWQGKVS
jgi:hypothetical protein